MTKNFKRKQVQARKSHAKAVLTNLHALRQRRYVGDLDASDTLIDFERAVSMAQLTSRQTEALRLVYDVGLTQKLAALEMGVGQDVVSEHIRKATEELDEVYEMWAWMDGELSASDFENDEMEAV